MSQNLLRVRDGQGASVSFSELLFDLIYVFAVTQLSHYLLHHLTLTGALETLLLWFAVWLARQYTARSPTGSIRIPVRSACCCSLSCCWGCSPPPHCRRRSASAA